MAWAYQFSNSQYILQPCRPLDRPHVDCRYQTWSQNETTSKKKMPPKNWPVAAMAIRVSAQRLLRSPGALLLPSRGIAEQSKKDKMDGVNLKSKGGCFVSVTVKVAFEQPSELGMLKYLLLHQHQNQHQHQHLYKHRHQHRAIVSEHERLIHLQSAC